MKNYMRIDPGSNNLQLDLLLGRATEHGIALNPQSGTGCAWLEIGGGGTLFAVWESEELPRRDDMLCSVFRAHRALEQIRKYGFDEAANTFQLEFANELANYHDTERARDRLNAEQELVREDLSRKLGLWDAS